MQVNRDSYATVTQALSVVVDACTSTDDVATKLCYISAQFITQTLHAGTKPKQHSNDVQMMAAFCQLLRSTFGEVNLRVN